MPDEEEDEEAEVRARVAAFGLRLRYLRRLLACIDNARLHTHFTRAYICGIVFAQACIYTDSAANLRAHALLQICEIHVFYCAPLSFHSVLTLLGRQADPVLALQGERRRGQGKTKREGQPDARTGAQTGPQTDARFGTLTGPWADARTHLRMLHCAAARAEPRVQVRDLRQLLLLGPAR
eukprot:6174168-Pleurochrysis_carterae.AAC.1